MLSVNQLNAQIKITEAWKASKDDNHPIKFKKVSNEWATRSISNGDLVETGKTDLVKALFISDASKAWNRKPITVKKLQYTMVSKKGH